MITRILMLALCIAVSARTAHGLQFNILNATSNELSFVLLGNLDGPPPASGLNNLFIEGAGNWLSAPSGSSLESTGTVITGFSTPIAQAESGGAYGSYINLTLGSSLSGNNTGNGTVVTLTGTNAFDWSQPVKLGLYWGVNGETSAPFGVPQGNLQVVPEPSVAILLGHFSGFVICFALRRGQSA